MAIDSNYFDSDWLSSSRLSEAILDGQSLIVARQMKCAISSARIGRKIKESHQKLQKAGVEDITNVKIEMHKLTTKMCAISGSLHKLKSTSARAKSLENSLSKGYLSKYSLGLGCSRRNYHPSIYSYPHTLHSCTWSCEHDGNWVADRYGGKHGFVRRKQASSASCFRCFCVPNPGKTVRRSMEENENWKILTTTDNLEPTDSIPPIIFDSCSVTACCKTKAHYLTF